MPQTVEPKEVILKVLECNDLNLSTRGLGEGLVMSLFR
jgi:hypothetical protein